MISIPVMVWSFHTYQTFVIVYAVMVGFAYILLRISGVICAERKDVTWKALLLEHIAVFRVANLAGWLITSIFFRSSGYLESTIAWGTVSLGTCIKKIIEHTALIFSGDKLLALFEYKKNIFYTAFYGIFSVITVLLILKEFLRNNKVHFFMMFSAVVCIQISPLLLTVYMGNIQLEPHYAISTWHACSEMNAMGIYRRQASDDNIQSAREIAIDMPSWPAKDSVKDVGDYVIVKLGTDEWIEEVQ